LSFLRETKCAGSDSLLYTNNMFSVIFVQNPFFQRKVIVEPKMRLPSRQEWWFTKIFKFTVSCPQRKNNNKSTSVMLNYLKTLLDIFYVSYNILRKQIYDNSTKQTLVLWFSLIWLFCFLQIDLKVFGRTKNLSMHTNYLQLGYY